jgi:hypothetical protein
MSDESRRKFGGRPMPFPTNLQMVMDVSTILKTKLIETVRANTSLLLN